MPIQNNYGYRNYQNNYLRNKNNFSCHICHKFGHFAKSYFMNKFSTSQEKFNSDTRLFSRGSKLVKF